MSCGAYGECRRLAREALATGMPLPVYRSSHGWWTRRCLRDAGSDTSRPFGQHLGLATCAPHLYSRQSSPTYRGAKAIAVGCCLGIAQCLRHPQQWWPVALGPCPLAPPNVPAGMPSACSTEAKVEPMGITGCDIVLISTYHGIIRQEATTGFLMIFSHVCILEQGCGQRKGVEWRRPQRIIRHWADPSNRS